MSSTLEPGRPSEPGNPWRRGLVASACLLCLAGARAQAQAVPQAPAAAPADAASAPEATQTLPVIRARAANDSPTTEGTGSYTAPASTAGSRTPQRLRETPQSISIVTRQRLEDQNITRIEEALKYTTGMTVTRFDGAGNFNVVSSRGFDAGAIQLDGLPVPQAGNANYATYDAAIFDRIEVLRGPGGLLQGAGEPGGTINLVRKRPGPSFAASGALSLGSWGKRRLELDASTPLNESGSVRGRVVGVIDDSDSSVDLLYNHKRVLYATLEAELGADTTLALGGTKQTIDAVLDQGLPTYTDGTLLAVKRSTFAGTDWNEQDPDTSDAFVELEHRLGGGALVKLALRQVERDMLYRGGRAALAVDPAVGNTALQLVAYEQAATNRLADLFFATPFTAWSRKHQWMVGLSYAQEKTGSHFAFASTNPPLNIDDPDHAVAQPDFTLAPIASHTLQTQKGLYTQLTLQALERLRLVLGGRMSWWDTRTEQLATGAVTAVSKPPRKFTSTSGLIYDLGERWSAYASYAQTFVPQTATTVAGELLPARTGSQVEAGLKGELLDKRLNAHLAIFRIIDKHRAIDDPNDEATASIAGGKVRSQGLEAEISGQPLRGWDLTAGYAYTSTRYLEGTPAQQGQVFNTVTPRHNISLWSRYLFGAGPLARLSVGGGLRVVSDFYAQSGTLKISQGGYTVASAQVGYALTDQWALSLTVNNLFDRIYYEKLSGTSRQNFYGEPRSALLSLRGHF